MISQKEQQLKRIDWRRNKVRELTVKGNNQRQIASILNVALTTVNQDLKYFRIEAKNNIAKYIDEYLPAEYENCMNGLNSILIEAWKTAEKAEEEGDTRDKLAALELAQSCYSMKLDLLSSATVIDRAVKFVEYHKPKPLPSIDEINEVVIEDNNNDALEPQ